LASRIEETFYPNITNSEPQIPFEPIEIWISKKGYELYLVTGDYIIARFQSD
jgi:hypothetical protein